MGPICTIVSTVTTASPDDCYRLFHGTLARHVSSLGEGIDFTKCGGEFWATKDLENARYYGQIAAQQLMFAGGDPGQAIFAFNLPIKVFDYFEEQRWMVIYSHGIKFLPACSAPLKEEMKNIEVTFEQ